MTKLRSRKNTEKYLHRLQSVECPDTTFFGERFPIVMKKASGMNVRDVDGNSYLDFTACFGVLALGHRPKSTLHTLRMQSALLLHGMGDVHPTPAKIKFLELLARITPYAHSKSLLGQSGGDAIEAAIKTAMLATKRNRFLSFSGGYHGLQFAPLSLNDREEFIQGFEAWTAGRAVKLPFPYFKADIFSHTDELSKEFLEQIHELYSPEYVLQKLEDNLRTKEFAALVLEPIQGRGGKRGFSAEFLKSCQMLCKKFGTLLVFDEIFTGFGRTGKMFAYELFDVIPDLLCLGKAMGGGLPLSACVGDILDVWGKSKGEARHTQTFLGNPLSCAVGYKTVLTIQKQLPKFNKELIAIENIFEQFILKMHDEGLANRFPFELRGRGFMKGIWFYKEKPGFAVTLMEQLLERGFLILPEGPRADVLSFTPSLIVTALHYEKLFNSLLEILKEI